MSNIKISTKRSSKKKKRFLLSRKSEWMAEECLTQLFPHVVGLYVCKLNNIVKVDHSYCKHEVKHEPLGEKTFGEVRCREENNSTATNQVFYYKLYSFLLPPFGINESSKTKCFCV